MASTFVTDFGTAPGLEPPLSIRPTWWLVPFLLVSAGLIVPHAPPALLGSFPATAAG